MMENNYGEYDPGPALVSSGSRSRTVFRGALRDLHSCSHPEVCIIIKIIMMMMIIREPPLLFPSWGLRLFMAYFDKWSTNQ